MTHLEVRPLPRVVKGDPSPEELAALVAVVAAGTASRPDRPAEPRRSAWAAPQRRLRRPLATGPRAWRSFGRAR